MVVSACLFLLSCDGPPGENVPQPEAGDTPNTVNPPSGGSTNATTIRVGSFNPQVLGHTKVSRTFTFSVIADIATKFDLIAFEEVGSNNSTALETTCVSVLESLIAKMNLLAPRALYAYIRGNQYALVYNEKTLVCVSSSMYSGSQSFSYTPLTGVFKTVSGNLDFAVVVIHTSPTLASSEIPKLPTVMSEVRTHYTEPDVVCLGDFNADGNYYAEGSGADLSCFPSVSYITGIPNSADTTVATSSNTYDRIEMSSTMTSDYTGTWKVISFVPEYDVSKCEGATTTAGTENAISDHYPVAVELYTARDTD